MCHPSPFLFCGLLCVCACETVDPCDHVMSGLTSFVSPCIFLDLWSCHVGIRRNRYSRPPLIFLSSVLRRRSRRVPTPTASVVFVFRFLRMLAKGHVPFSRIGTHVFCVTLLLSSFVDCRVCLCVWNRCSLFSCHVGTHVFCVTLGLSSFRVMSLRMRRLCSCLCLCLKLGVFSCG